MVWGETIIAVISSNILTAVATNWANKRKTKAEAVTIAMDGTVKWAESMRKDIESLRTDLDTLRDKYVRLLEENKNLHIEVAGLRLELAQYKKGS